jgi:hypothetical protein
MRITSNHHDQGDKYHDRGLPEKESVLGEVIGKGTRNTLALLCLKAAASASPDIKQRSPGRPRGPQGKLAEVLGVNVRTVERWIDPEDIQASDSNAERLAEYAYTFYPNEVSKLLLAEATDHLHIVENWLTTMNGRQ